VYSLSSFGEMLLDQVRMDPYVRALKQVVRPDSVVLDIGTGPGFFAVLAHRLGARRVIAVEPSDSIQIAREIAAANGCGDVIEFHQALSTEIELAEQADVIISDLRGVVPLFQRHIPAIVDARRRLLAPGGTMIPLRDTIYVSVLEAPKAHRQITSPWAERPHGIDLRAAQRCMVSQWGQQKPEASQLLTAAVPIASLDYSTIVGPNIASEAVLKATRDGTAHGLCVWFDATLLPGIGFSNAPAAPGVPRAIYGCAFFPVPEPVAMLAGDEVRVSIAANLVEDDYVWRWATQFRSGDDGCVRASFKQSSLGAEFISHARLRKGSADFRPQLSPDGELDRSILDRMHRGSTLGEISRELAVEHPNRFDDWKHALARVGEISRRYSR